MNNQTRQFIRYREIAKGSGGELRSQFFLLFKAGKIEEYSYQAYYQDLIHLSGELKGLIKYLKGFEGGGVKGA
ncbi:hypothetical protein GCM10009119_12030 [Algoriphagus jejuensis]|uniref:Four helix bundle protein n=1 Tax=Algoriphagus jejuensis TaxID=419934 RepID=A0ABP3YBW5_9BACT